MYFTYRHCFNICFSKVFAHLSVCTGNIHLQIHFVHIYKKNCYNDNIVKYNATVSIIIQCYLLLFFIPDNQMIQRKKLVAHII